MKFPTVRTLSIGLMIWAALAKNSIHAQGTPSCTPPPAGIVGWWPAEGNANDIVGANNGTLIGNVTYANGEVGQAFNFNTLGDQVSVSTSGFPIGASDRTLECWVYINSFIPNEGALFAFYGTSGDGGAYSIGIFTDQRVYFSQWGQIIEGPILTTKQWYHVAVTSGGGISTLYLNGTNVASGNLPFNTPAGSQLFIGAINNYQTIGLIDELSIYNRALSQAEIQAIYNAGIGGKCTGPVSPQIITQPTNQAVFVGQTASFSVVANGAPPLSYQWVFNSTNNIAGATNATLNLSSVMFTNAGNYAVLVSNGVNSILSTNAVLTVNPPLPCTPPPAGIVGWWSAEGNANDIIGTNNGTLIGGATYTQGEVGQAFNFTTGSDQVAVSTGGFPVGTSDRTLECWVYINSFIPGEGALFAFYGTTGDGGAYSFGAFSDQRLFFSQWGGIMFGPVLTTGQWYHVAVTSAGGTSTLYLDGTNVASGYLPFNTPADSQLLIGSIHNEFANYQMIGSIDELSIYNRALSQAEIQAIYNAGIGGKCTSPVAPIIIIQPVNQAVLMGQTASFSVLADGTPSLSYQWSLNTTNVGGATNSTLVLNNVQYTNAGIYSVLVRNELGSILSSNVVLTVNPPCTPPSGLVGWWKGEGDTLDSMGTNNGILIGGATYTQGEVGQAFNFTTGSDQVAVSTGGFPVGTSDRTLECWVYINSFIPGEGALFAFYGTTGDGGAYSFGAFSDQRLFFSQWGGIMFGPVLTTGQWYHVAVTSAGGTSTLYLDGTNVASGYLPFNTPADSQLLIGSIHNEFANYQMIGSIDELSIYNRSLYPAEIAAIYNAGSAGKCYLPPYIPPPRTATATAEWAGAFVVGVDIIDGGAGYTNTPNIRLIGGGGTGAQASVTVSNGVVVAIDVTNPGSGYTNTPIVVIDPPFISNPVLGIASISMLNFSNLFIGTNYQLQQFQSTTWVNQSGSFTATNNFYATTVLGAVDSGDYRLAQIPVPVQATAVAQVVNGFVVTVSVDNPGSGYVIVPAVTIIANVGSNATAAASINNGMVTSITVTSPGIHYVNPVTVQIDPPPVAALSPAITSGVVINSSGLAPYDNYQIQFRPEINAVWSNLNDGLFVPSSTIDSQYVFLTNSAGYFRLQYVP